MPRRKHRRPELHHLLESRACGGSKRRPAAGGASRWRTRGPRRTWWWSTSVALYDQQNCARHRRRAGRGGHHDDACRDFRSSQDRRRAGLGRHAAVRRARVQGHSVRRAAGWRSALAGAAAGREVDGVRKTETSPAPACRPGAAARSRSTSPIDLPDSPKPSEDCLYLNVWTQANRANDRRPVMVWIFGGAYSEGGGNTPHNDGENLAKKGVVARQLQLPPRHVRLLRASGADEGIGPQRVGQSGAGRRHRRVAVGQGQHRGVWWRPEQRHHLRRVGGRGDRRHALRFAGGQGPVPEGQSPRAVRGWDWAWAPMRPRAQAEAAALAPPGRGGRGGRGGAAATPHRTSRTTAGAAARRAARAVRPTRSLGAAAAASRSSTAGSSRRISRSRLPTASRTLSM